MRFQWDEDKAQEPGFVDGDAAVGLFSPAGNELSPAVPLQKGDR